MRTALRTLTLLTIAVVVLGVGRAALAQETCGTIPFIPSVTIPGTPIEQGKTYNLDCTSIGTYIISLYQFGVYAASIVAAVMVMVGGFLWVTAGGNSSQVSTAKSFVGGALSGFVLLLGSWLILNTINPNLVRFNPLNIPSIPEEPVTSSSGGLCQGAAGHQLIQDAELQEKRHAARAEGYKLEQGAYDDCNITASTQQSNYFSNGWKCYCKVKVSDAAEEKDCCGGQRAASCPALGGAPSCVSIVEVGKDQPCPQSTDTRIAKPRDKSCDEVMDAQFGGFPRCSLCGQ